jgi:hypothetical protein
MLETIPAPANPNFDAVRNGLRELGYDEGRTSFLSIDLPMAAPNASRY